MANLGFIGLGVMGGQMVDRLLNHGHTVTGYNRTRAKAQWLIDKGMKLADTPRGVCEAADVIALDGHQLGRARTGRGRRRTECSAGLSAGKVLIDMSTVSPAVSQALAAKVRAKGADMVDAPVSGSVITLQQGKLSVMVGGRKETFERVKPLLLDIGPEGDARRRKRPGAGDEDRDQPESGGRRCWRFPKACCWPKRAAFRARLRWTC